MLKLRLEDNNERKVIIEYCKDLGVDYKIDREETVDIETGLLERFEDFVIFESYTEGKVIIDLLQERRAC